MSIERCERARIGTHREDLAKRATNEAVVVHHGQWIASAINTGRHFGGRLWTTRPRRSCAGRKAALVCHDRDAYEY